MAEKIFDKFLKDNIIEIMLALIVSGLLVLILDFNITESLSFMVLCVGVAIIFNQAFRAFVPEGDMRRNTLLILTVIASFFLLQYFDIGIFSIENINSENFGNTEISPQIQAASTGITAFFKALNIGKMGVVATIVSLFLGLIFYAPKGVGIWIGLGILVLLGVLLFPLITVLSQNFTLIMIFVGLFAAGKLFFRGARRERTYKLVEQ